MVELKKKTKTITVTYTYFVVFVLQMHDIKNLRSAYHVYSFIS